MGADLRKKWVKHFNDSSQGAFKYESPAIYERILNLPSRRYGPEIFLDMDGQYILCGPLAFMQSTRSKLIDAGVPATSIRYEIFGPDLWLAA